MPVDVGVYASDRTVLVPLVRVFTAPNCVKVTPSLETSKRTWPVAPDVTVAVSVTDLPRLIEQADRHVSVQDCFLHTVKGSSLLPLCEL